MIKKIVKIRNIGRLEKVVAVGDVEFRHTTLIFRENGRGKSSLYDIIRSLSSGEPAYVQGRQTLSSTGDPEIELLLDSGMVSFKNNAWSNIEPNILIFDTNFVHDNVYVGDVVEHDQKRNLYRVIVGDEGVRLARVIDDLDAGMRKIDRDINSKKSTVQRLATAGMSANEFVSLAENPDVDRDIETARVNLNALSRADEIASTPAPKPLSLGDLPSNFVDLLSSSLVDVSAKAEQAVHTHTTEKRREQPTIGFNKDWIS